MVVFTQIVVMGFGIDKIYLRNKRVTNFCGHPLILYSEGDTGLLSNTRFSNRVLSLFCIEQKRLDVKNNKKQLLEEKQFVYLPR